MDHVEKMFRRGSLLIQSAREGAVRLNERQVRFLQYCYLLNKKIDEESRKALLTISNSVVFLTVVAMFALFAAKMVGGSFQNLPDPIALDFVVTVVAGSALIAILELLQRKEKEYCDLISHHASDGLW